MAVNRGKILKELEPGLNKVFGEEYKNYDMEHKEIFSMENSKRAFEEEVLFVGFDVAPTKNEGEAITYDEASESWVARYNHVTIALAFALTEEAMEDNLYVPLATRLTKELARSMAQTKQIRGANVLNNAFSSSYTGGDGKELLATDHPLWTGGTLSNEPSTASDLSEAALEQALIDIAGFTDDRGKRIAAQGKKLIIPRQLEFVACRLLSPAATMRVGTADNDINAIVNKGYLPGGYVVNHFLTDTDAWFITTDVPNGLKMFNRVNMQRGMEGDFETGNVRYKARERYSFGWSDFRGMYGSPGS